VGIGRPDSERAKRALTVATFVLMVLIFFVGLLSTGFLSALCGVEPTQGSYCARISQGRFPIEELCLVLAPVVLAAWPGLLSIRRRSARPLLGASVPLLLFTVLLPFAVEIVWS